MRLLVVTEAETSLFRLDKWCKINDDVRISDVRHSNENLEWVLFVGLANSSFDFPLDFGFTLFAMTVVLLNKGSNRIGLSTYVVNPSSFL